MPDISPDPDTPPAGKRRRFTWTWPRLLAVSFLVIVLAIAGLLLYDEPLRPYDDLELPLIAAVPAAENGWDFLSGKWEALPKPKSAVKEKLAGLLSGNTPWDETDPDLAAAADAGGLRMAELREALALPVWQAGEPTTLSELDANLGWVMTGLRPLDARYLQLLRNHSLPEAKEVADLQLELGRTYVRNPPTLIHFLVGNSLLKKWVGSVPLMLDAAGPDNDALAAALQLELQSDWLAPETLRQTILREARLFRSATLTATASGMGANALQFRLLFKRHRTVNDHSANLRRLLPLLLKPMDSHSESIHDIYTHFRARPNLRKLSDLNYFGSQLIDSQYQVIDLVDYGTRTTLALQRAMNVRIALHRWKLMHGTLPVTLTELVPEFLPAIPADPYDGRPLRWDPTRFGGLIYSVGQDLKDNPAALFDGGRQPFGWTNNDSKNPAIRLELPPPAAKVPVKAGKTPPPASSAPDLSPAPGTPETKKPSVSQKRENKSAKIIIKELR